MCCIGISLIVTTFRKFGASSPPSAVLSTLARLSLFPHLRIALNSHQALYYIIKQDPPALTLLPSPIFPYSFHLQQYSGLSFLAALTKKLRIVFSEFQTNLPTDPSHLPKYIKVSKDDPFKITHLLDFCSNSFLFLTLLLNATPPIKVDSEDLKIWIRADPNGYTQI
ncbi:hypothetical protein BLNAU_3911 [Blattamonas nauphoetae]|uniref:Uncharacterized protein n=1 Tax=Blattamonas nauphoetae TaxID=2049346 RepID=A0ABQ9YBK4_9EUKA|nr:hypothetical protein BLNAU_3911 [Blattamonas nauphoetae]